jgi:hypothetical protein
LGKGRFVRSSHTRGKRKPWESTITIVSKRLNQVIFKSSNTSRGGNRYGDPFQCHSALVSMLYSYWGLTNHIIAVTI